MTLPIESPVLFFTVLAALVLFVPMLCEQIRLPGLVGLIVAAMILGPYGTGVLERNTLVQYLGQAGLLFIVFVAGLEIDLARFAKYRNHSLVFGSISYLVPQVVGAVLGVFVLKFDLTQAILLGSMFGSHTLLAYPVASRLGITRTHPVTTSVGGSIVTDTSAFLVLAIIANSVSGDAGWDFWARFALMLALFVALVFRVLPRVARWFYRTVPDEGSRDFLFTILMLFVCASLAEFAGVQPIIGAFMCGIALNRLIPERSPLMSRVQFVGRTLLVPVFLVSVGMLVDPRAIVGDRATLLVVATMTVAVVATKFVAAFSAGKLLRYTHNENWVMFGMTVNQAAGTLAAVIVGFDLGLFDSSVVNGAIVMMLLTCLIGPSVTERWGRKLAEVAELAPVDRKDAPQRILIPVANPATVEPLMDLALLLREPTSKQPIFPLAIVTEGSDIDSKIARSEKLLAHAAVRGNAGDAPVFPVTRVDVNIAEGIRRTMAEHQITTVVIGWNGEISLASRIFGGVVDQLLEQSRQLVVVAKIDRSLNDTARVLLIAPRSAERESSFSASIHLVKVLCQQLSTPLHVLGPSVETKRFQGICRETKPDVPTTMRPIPGLRDLPDMLGTELRPHDLVILLSAREHRVSWTQSLEMLPRHLASEFPAQPFLVLYAAEVAETLVPREEPIQPDAPVAIETGAVVAAQRIAVHTTHADLQRVIHDLLAVDFASDPEALERLTAELHRSAGEFPIEIHDSTFILHAHDEAAARPLLYLATSVSGIPLPASGETAQALLLLVSPADSPPEDHLQLLRRIALHLRKGDVAETLRASPDHARVLAALRSIDTPSA
ncbi:cation:proton antiporter [Opitutales bacterium ASA1]|uniref:cation:proton antiporter domain-containing protein n=1 Tax=Congregicoccus parvus TaxID=3081749 RepID=UPI002B3185E9|nr:cation:proton antiporter [Opitutales bacterium ASA1]